MANEIEFDAEEKAAIVASVQRYFGDALAQELGRFDAEFLVDCFVRELGPRCDNAGRRDAQVALAAVTDHVQDALYQLDKPVDDR